MLMGNRRRRVSVCARTQHNPSIHDIVIPRIQIFNTKHAFKYALLRELNSDLYLKLIQTLL